MAKRGSADVAFVLLDGREIAGSLVSFEDKHAARTEQSDGLGDAWTEHQFIGVREAEITWDGFYDDGTGSLHQALSTGPGQSKILTYGLEGTATGARFVGWEGALQGNYERLMELAGLQKARATFKTNGAVDEGRILKTWRPPAGGTTGDTTGTPYDWGVSTTGGVGYLQYQTSDLTTTSGEAQYNILHSSDNVTYSAIITFACSTAGVGADRQVTTAVIERFTAAQYTTANVSGSTGGSFFVGLARGGTS